MHVFVVLLLLFGSLMDHQVSAKVCDLKSGIKTAANLATLEIPSGVTGGVLRLLIAHLWPDDCDPRVDVKKVVRDAINESEEKELKRTFDGIEIALEDMERRGDYDEDALGSFYDSAINANTPDFVRTDHPTTFIYFRDYATLKLTILAKLRELDHAKWNADYVDAAEELANAAWEIIVKVPKLNPSSDCSNLEMEGVTHNEEIWCTGAKRQKIMDHLWVLMNKWRQIANLREKPSIEVKDWDWIQLRMSSSSSHHWVSCWVSGSMCVGRKCPGKDGSSASDCRGEWFSIVNNQGGAIKACDRVGIRYSWFKDKDEGWWLSSHWAPDVYTAKCPYKTFSTLRYNNACISEEWRIYAAGKACGVPIEHSDVISLESANEGYSLTTRTFHGMYDSPVFGSGLKLDGPLSGSPTAYSFRAYRRSFIIFKKGQYNSRYNW